MTPEKHFYDFGSFRVDASERLLFREGRPVALTPKVFDTLLLLVENAGHILEKDELMKRVWPDAIVEENNLNQNISTLRKVLGKSKRDHSFIETIPRRGYRFVAEVKERRANSVAAAGEEVTVETPREIGPSRRLADWPLPRESNAAPKSFGAELRRVSSLPANRRWGFIILATLLVLGVVGLTVGRYIRSRRETSSLDQAGGSGTVVMAKNRRSVAVLGFKNLSGRPEVAWLSTAFCEMLSTELAAGGELRLIPEENIARMKVELRLADADSYGKNTLIRVRKNLGADLVVLGSYTDLGKESGGQIRLDLRLQDSVAGETIAEVAEIGNESDLSDLMTRAGGRLREKLGVSEISTADASGVRAALPSNPEGARLYSEGLAKLRLFDASAARDLLEKAVSADSTSALAHSALSSAFSSLGYDAKAQEEAKKAFDLSASLSRTDRLWVEGQYRKTTQEWDKASAIYGTLFKLLPDNIEYGLQLAATQTWAGKARDALATIGTLRKGPPPGSDDPRIDLAEAEAAHAVSDIRRAQAAAHNAGTKSQAQGARLLVARAGVLEAWVDSDLGQFDAAIRAASAARDIYTSAGDKDGVAHALWQITNAFQFKGDLIQANRAARQALALEREIGDQHGVAISLNNLANLLTDEGNLAEAKDLQSEAVAIERRTGHKNGLAIDLINLGATLDDLGDIAAAKNIDEEALAVQQEAGFRDGTAWTLNNLAGVMEQQGDMTGATARYQQAVAIHRELGDQRGLALDLGSLGHHLFLQGDLAGAKKMCDESSQISQEIGDKADLAYALTLWAEIVWAQGDLDGAKAKLDQAVAAQKGLGEKSKMAQARIALAELSIEKGQGARAEIIARGTAEEFKKRTMADEEAYARAVLARALLAQGNIGRSQDVMARAQDLVANSQNRLTRIRVSIAAARIQASRKDSDVAEATKNLESTLAETKKLGLVAYEFEARLALGELAMRSNPAARNDLEALAQDAQAKGFGLVARKASAATRPSPQAKVH